MKKIDLGDFDRSAGDAAKAQDAGDQRDNQKRNNPAQHGHDLCFDYLSRDRRGWTRAHLLQNNPARERKFRAARRWRKFADRAEQIRGPAETAACAGKPVKSRRTPYIGINPC